MPSINKIRYGGIDYDILKEELETKANVDGSYDNMTVGNAKQLVATVGITDKVPYNFRTSGGSADIGDREVDKIVGGTVAWNQLCTIPGSDVSKVENGVTIVDNRDGSYTVSTESGGATANVYLTTHSLPMLAEHKYLWQSTPSGGSSSTYYSYIAAADTGRNDYGAGTIFFKNTSGNGYLVPIYVKSGTVITTPIKFVPQCFDLTQIFGSTIADYIYSLEQSQAGAGVAWFRKLFPKPYYAYNAGSLQSVQTSEHKMVGFNQWDEEWEVGRYNSSTGIKETFTTTIRSKNYIPIVPDTSYYCYIGSTTINHVNICYYDANKNFISFVSSATNPKITPSNAYYMTFYVDSVYGTTYKNDICINLHWDGERDGEYEPYVEYTYPLDDSLTFRGIPKLDSGNNLYYDGDVYEADGTVNHRYGIVDLGTLNWQYYDIEGHNRFIATLSGIKDCSAQVKANMICSKYTVDTANNIFNNVTDKKIGTNANIIFIYDTAYTDAATFKTAMSGVYLVYELVEPTTESADPFTNPQIVDDFGTEEYVDAGVTASTPTRDVAIPVGHETVYQANLRAKLEMAPNSPDGDGDYIVRQTNGENEYVLLEEELPSAPSSDGTYVLKATVASGTVTLTWVEET